MPQNKSVADQELLEMLVAADLKENPPAKPEPTGKLDGASRGLLIGGNLADLGSTIYALKHGAREANPVLGDHPSAAKLMAVKGATTAAQYLLLKFLAKDRPKLANALAKGAGIGMGGIAAWNLAQAHKSKD